MLHITHSIADHADRTLSLLEQAHSRRNALLHPELPPQIHHLKGGVVTFHDGQTLTGRATRFGMEGPVDQETIEQVETLFATRKQIVRFIVCPFGESGFTRQLEERGYRIDLWLQTLVRSLDTLPDPMKLAPELAIVPVSPEDISLWAETMGRGFRSLGHEHLMDPEFHRPIAHLPEARIYLAYWNETVAGAASLVLLNGWAFVLGASTLPEYRNRGIQGALIRQRLSDAAAACCSHALLITDPGSDSQRNAERQGFQVAYTMPVFKKA